MSDLTICKYGDPVLRESAQPVEAVNDEIRTLVDNMLQTMRDENGIGLAAEQVGDTRRLCVIEIPARADVDEEGNRLNPDAEMPLVLINPEITWTNDETVLMEEGCLSFPGIYAPIVRPTEAVVQYLDRNGKEKERHTRGLLARAIQHEIDHLDGILIVDRMSRVKKVALSGRLKRLRKETQGQLAPAAS